MPDIYDLGFNDGIYKATDFLKAVAKDFRDFGNEYSEDALLLDEMADVILEDLKDIPEDEDEEELEEDID